MSVGQVLVGPHGLQAAPHFFETQSGCGWQLPTSPARHWPVRSQWPSSCGASQGGLAKWQGSETRHSSPQARPAQGFGAGQVNGVPWVTQVPVGSQTLTTAVSAHCGSSGAQSWHQDPQVLPAHGS
jgi:hypothetical protein